jgi:NMD protein affecting ribosome stability and mRNA decay
MSPDEDNITRCVVCGKTEAQAAARMKEICQRPGVQQEVKEVTIETTEVFRCAECGEEFKEKRSRGQHQRWCKASKPVSNMPENMPRQAQKAKPAASGITFPPFNDNWKVEAQVAWFDVYVRLYSLGAIR